MYKYNPQEHNTLSRSEVRDFDTWAINDAGIPGVVLMENAGRNTADHIKAKLGEICAPEVTIFTGIGNNGGDGFVIARHLENDCMEVRIIICGDPENYKGDAKINYDIARNLGIDIYTLDFERNIVQQIESFTEATDLIVDAIFGTGLQGQLRTGYDTLIDSINSQGKDVLAVDIPSGLDCNTGLPLNTAIKASETVTFVAAKKGFAEPTAKAFTGEVFIADIGIAPFMKKE